MSYSELYFGKDFNEIIYDDIVNFFIGEKEESNKIEFKSYYSQEEKNHTDKLNGVVRTVCGLLNSEGGIVIWGAPIGQQVEGKKEKIFKGELSPSDTLIEKDAFISKITDLITPAPKSINFKSLENSGKYIYIIEVEQSLYSPHQFRNIYYMRIDGHTRPAPHHYIEALFKKITFPRLEGYIKVESVQPVGNDIVLQFSNMIFNKSKLQNEYEIYYRLLISIGKFSYFGNDQRKNRFYEKQNDLKVINDKPVLYFSEDLINTENVIIPTGDLIKANYQVQIIFYFGGKKSPLMISNYTLSLIDLKPVLTQMDENKFLYEIRENLDISEIERMKLILGR